MSGVISHYSIVFSCLFFCTFRKVPPIGIDKVISETVASSDGLLGFVEPRAVQNHSFTMEGSMFIVGPKHMLDNIIGDMLGKMNHFESFQSSLKVCCDAW